MKVFTIWDLKANLHLRPFADANTVSAIRGFERAAEDPESPFKRYPQDFVLKEIGEFDEMTGRIVLNESPQVICSALDFVKKPQASVVSVQ